MKTKIKIISLMLMLCIGAWVKPQKASAQEPVNFQVFYDGLSPYGTWVNNPYYGYVWFPKMDPGFSPYATNGYWTFTEDGWMWVSEYPWGWAPFHYGRWFYDEAYGPMWVPGYEWGPGWVNWRSSDDYYGWVPMGPDVNYGNGYNEPYKHWRFVKHRDFGKTDINNYYVNTTNNITIINNSTVINNTFVDKTHNVTYKAGPEKTEVEKYAGKTFTPVSIKESSKPAQTLKENQLEIYKPQVQKTITTGTKPAPTNVENLKNVKTLEQRTAETSTQSQKNKANKKVKGVKPKPSQNKEEEK